MAFAKNTKDNKGSVVTVNNMQVWPCFGATQVIGLKGVNGKAVFDAKAEPCI